ncbi:hypothetical protein AVEN_187207-1 [Araneus ventricosus]|uniref:Uncharacterized protein n=1 Tax=Araneus ventricosus TaxID=182803 RepID=A0A4Y2UCA0_ARAVE|nr:hypothetical protein AVEN_187207-1 [Araneus ventricosus]
MRKIRGQVILFHTFTPARTSGGLHLDFPLGGAYHPWLAFRCPIRRRVPPMARTDMSHQEVHTTRGLHLDVPSDGAYQRWHALIYPIRRRIPPVARTSVFHQAVCTTNDSVRLATRKNSRYFKIKIMEI